MFKLDRNLEDAVNLLGTPVDGMQTQVEPDDSDLVALRDACSSFEVSRILNRPIFQFIKHEIPATPSSPHFFQFTDLDSRLHVPYEALLNAFFASAGNPVSVNAAIGDAGTLLVVAQHGTGFDFKSAIASLPESRPSFAQNGNGLAAMAASGNWEVSFQQDGDGFLTIMYCKKPVKTPQVDPDERRRHRFEWMISEIKLEYPDWREQLDAIPEPEQQIEFIRASKNNLPLDGEHHRLGTLIHRLLNDRLFSQAV